MNVKVFLIPIVAFFALHPGGVSEARPYIENVGRLEIDWSTHKIHFYGEAKLPEAAEPQETYRDIEKAAWQDGLNYVAGAMRDYHVSMFESHLSDTSKLAADAKLAAQAAARATTSRKTVYYSDGTVRVVLENTLPKALTSPALRFRQKEAMVSNTTRYSGVVFQLDRSVKARPIYKVVDESGALLFDEADMAEQAFHQHMMGHWYIKPSAAELSTVVGKTPLKVSAKVDEQGRFVVSKAVWNNALSGYRSLLVGGRIAISLPESQ